MAAGRLAGSGRPLGLTAPQCGRLMPLALDAASAGPALSLATFGLSQDQIDAVPVAVAFAPRSPAALQRLRRALVRLLRPGYVPEEDRRTWSREYLIVAPGAGAAPGRNDRP